MTEKNELGKWIDALKDFQKFIEKHPELNVQEADSPAFETSEIIGFIIVRLKYLKNKEL